VVCTATLCAPGHGEAYTACGQRVMARCRVPIRAARRLCYRLAGIVRDMAREIEIDEQITVGALAELPGFIAGGVTLGPPATLTLVAGCQENSGVPLLQVLCTPKR